MSLELLVLLLLLLRGIMRVSSVFKQVVVVGLRLLWAIGRLLCILIPGQTLMRQ